VDQPVLTTITTTGLPVEKVNTTDKYPCTLYKQVNYEISAGIWTEISAKTDTDTENFQSLVYSVRLTEP
jgi:hypothetical protein